jgi:hypothetical protein
MFRIIRVSQYHDFALVEDISTEELWKWDPSARLRRLRERSGREGGLERMSGKERIEMAFERVPASELIRFFFEHADSMGFGEMPNKDFSTIQEAGEWLEAKMVEALDLLHQKTAELLSSLD